MDKLQGKYGQTSYTEEPQRSWVTSVDDNYNITFESGEDGNPTLLFLETIVKARQDRESGKASPIFSSVEEMKAWFEKQSE
jgi:hypothetical protein